MKHTILIISVLAISLSIISSCDMVNKPHETLDTAQSLTALEASSDHDTASGTDTYIPETYFTETDAAETDTSETYITDTKTEEEPLIEVDVAASELGEYINDISEDDAYQGKSLKLRITDADRAVLTAIIHDNTAFCSDIVAKGSSVHFENPIQMYGNFEFAVFEADGVVVISKLYYNFGDTFAFWEGGTGEIHTSYDQKEDTTTSLYRDDDGHLKYFRMAKKFDANQFVYGVLYICTGRDEFYSEYGSAEVINNKLKFNAEKTYTLSEKVDLDALFDSWRRSECKDRNYETLDEWIEANKSMEPKQ
ncbi:MAG: hypothetical protein VB118_05535 [Oscillospiraceae bacterium]|nr:hypothetical protein [Oscillospiraceae bacterium]